MSDRLKDNLMWIANAAVILVIATAIAYAIHTEPDRPSCSTYENYALKNVPARCVGYYTDGKHR